MTTLPMISKVYLIEGVIKSKSSERDSLKPRHSTFFCYLDPGIKFRTAEQCFLMMAVYNLLGSNLETCAGIFGCPQNTCIYWAGMLESRNIQDSHQPQRFAPCPAHLSVLLDMNISRKLVYKTLSLESNSVLRINTFFLLLFCVKIILNFPGMRPQ